MRNWSLITLFALISCLDPGTAAWARDGQRRATVIPTPQISGASLRILAANQGLWQGYVSGTGLTRLELRILRRGQLEQRRSIGSVALNRGEPPVSFHYKATLPNGRDWSWQVVAAYH